MEVTVVESEISLKKAEGAAREMGMSFYHHRTQEALPRQNPGE